ncbi:MAG TPA: sel1 repeat family protein [candidate division Zixibacteria bacterium]|nr:sel1 repeat family protein [candidate division Zixibacteria bacterium]
MHIKYIILLLVFVAIPATGAKIEEAYKYIKNNQYGKALLILEKLDKENNALAQYYLAGMYSDGLGVQNDQIKSLSYIKKSAENGLPHAMNRLGNLYLNGSNYIKADPTKAYKWLKNAVDKEYISAGVILGGALVHGEGVNKKPKEGLEILKWAAAKGDKDAIFMVGNILYWGHSIKAKPAESIEWLHKAAMLGDSEAQRTLAHAYSTGHGVREINMIKAYSWALLAQWQGDTKARQLINKVIINHSTKNQREQGRILAMNIQKQIKMSNK